MRTLAHDDPAVALVASMHPSVLGLGLAVEEAPDHDERDAWSEQRNVAFRTALEGALVGNHHLGTSPFSLPMVLRAKVAAAELAEMCLTRLPKVIDDRAFSEARLAGGEPDAVSVDDVPEALLRQVKPGTTPPGHAPADSGVADVVRRWHGILRWMTGPDERPEPGRRRAHHLLIPPNPRSHGAEPDYRFSLANERTFLAWIRTALALAAGGLGAASLLDDFPGEEALGIGLLVLSFVTAAMSYRRWALSETAIRRDEALPPSRLPLVLAAGVAVVVIASATLVALNG